MSPAVFAHGHLRLYLLSLLAETEGGMHGYQIMQALGDRFGGTYVPSAGTIYPRLTKLDEEGLVVKFAEGRKTLYQITDAGQAELRSRQPELDAIENDMTDSVRRLADGVRSSVNEAMRAMRAELAAAARETRDERPEASAAEAHGGGSGVAVRIRLQQAEMALATFRASVRPELRRRAARNELSAETVTLFTKGLDDLRAQLEVGGPR